MANLPKQIKMIRNTFIRGTLFEQGDIKEIGIDLTPGEAVYIIHTGKAAPFGKGIFNRDPVIENRDPAPVQMEEPLHMGGGYYQLADGSKVRGKAKAYAASGLELPED